MARDADVDLYCDAHDLPFDGEVFDGVISTAVLEHVMYPDRVAGEMYRVLKPEGFLYSEIPFLQAVHEGAFDFFRFTMGAHRRLFEAFDEVSAGMVAGPGTALLWSLDSFARSLFRSRQMAKLATTTTRLLFFWVKYVDYLMVRNPAAIDGASCTYFHGRKTAVATSHRCIIERYRK